MTARKIGFQMGCGATVIHTIHTAPTCASAMDADIVATDSILTLCEFDHSGFDFVHLLHRMFVLRLPVY